MRPMIRSEEHPVGRDEDGQEDRHLAAPEEQPGEEVQQDSHRHAREHARQAPGERVLADVHRGGWSVRREGEQLLPVG
ncbi:MAG: hypothetical protein HY264_11225 [Chloroflexi bacterium]|nr:hypothetical protein [Chloroflexota bacterium]